MGSTLSASILVWDSQDRINALCATQCIENPILKGYVFNLKMGNSFLESNTSQKKTRFQCTLQHTHHRKLCWCLGTKSMHLEWSYTNFQWCVSRTVHRNISGGTPKYIETFQLGPQSTSKHFSWAPKCIENFHRGPQSASKNFTWDLKVHRKISTAPKYIQNFNVSLKVYRTSPGNHPGIWKRIAKNNLG